MNYFKKELGIKKYYKYCYLEINSKSKRIRNKARKILNFQVDTFYKLW